MGGRSPVRRVRVPGATACPHQSALPKAPSPKRPHQNAFTKALSPQRALTRAQRFAPLAPDGPAYVPHPQAHRALRRGQRVLVPVLSSVENLREAGRGALGLGHRSASGAAGRRRARNVAGRRALRSSDTRRTRTPRSGPARKSHAGNRDLVPPSPSTPHTLSHAPWGPGGGDTSDFPAGL